MGAENATGTFNPPSFGTKIQCGFIDRDIPLVFPQRSECREIRRWEAEEGQAMAGARAEPLLSALITKGCRDAHRAAPGFGGHSEHDFIV